jgi:hypothetical protein
MRRILVWACLSFLPACTKGPADPLPAQPAKRQTDLAEKILASMPQLSQADAATQTDGALAISQIAVPGYSPFLRLLVSGPNPILVHGAAVALVDIRLLRDKGPDTLLKCTQTETNPAVLAECQRRIMHSGTQTDPTPVPEVVRELGSTNVELQRSGLRHLLDLPDDTLQNPDVVRELAHHINDADLRVRLLTDAVFLRQSLHKDPPKPETTTN